jgi:hypothetical protein
MFYIHLWFMKKPVKHPIWIHNIPFFCPLNWKWGNHSQVMNESISWILGFRFLIRRELYFARLWSVLDFSPRTELRQLTRLILMT